VKPIDNKKALLELKGFSIIRKIQLSKIPGLVILKLKGVVLFSYILESSFIAPQTSVKYD